MDFNISRIWYLISGCLIFGIFIVWLISTKFDIQSLVDFLFASKNKPL